MCRPSPRAVPIFQCISSSSVLETLIEALKKENGMGGRTERGGPIKKPFRRLHERWRTSRGRTLLPNHAPSMHVSSKRLWHMLIMKNYEYCTSSIHPSSPLCVCGRRGRQAFAHAVFPDRHCGERETPSCWERDR